jgi:chitinase
MVLNCKSLLWFKLKAKNIIIASIFLLSLVSSLISNQLVHADTTYKFIGFVTWNGFLNVWDDGADISSDSSFDMFTHVIGIPIQPTSVNDGTVIPMYGESLDHYPVFVNEVHSHTGVKAMTYIYGCVGSDLVGAVNLTTLIANGELTDLVSSIHSFLDTYGLDGIEIDFEPPVNSDQTSINALIDAL